MKTNNLSNNQRFLIHALFWLVSINLWSFVFNPSSSGTNSLTLPDFWDIFVLINTVFFLFSLLPFTWLLEKTGRKFRIAATILFGAVFVAMVVQYVVKDPLFKDSYDIAEAYFKYFLYVVAFHLTIAGAVYFNLNILIKRQLAKRRFWIYISVLILLTVASSYANIFLFNYILDPLFPGLYYISYLKVWETVLATALYLLLTTSVYLLWNYRLILLTERQKSRDELAMLKSQINPHFLFNNLNTIYSMASANDPRTQEVILQLSDFLRYVLYDTSAEEIPLQKEVETMRTYISLQKERLDPKVNQVELTITGDFGEASISPLLLLPLAENCFKHGISDEPGKILVDIRFDGKTLVFRTENPVKVKKELLMEVQGGIGIQNVEKRLGLLYPDRHRLTYETRDGIFRLELTISL